MPHRRICVTSPIEPSGASWLLNCFLELDIRIDHKPVVDRVWRASNPPLEASRIWVGKNDHFALNPKAGVLKKFLPALSRRTEFRFRDDVSVEYVQDFPPRQLDQHDRVLMVRDPRDAIYSSYRRTAPALSFAEYLKFPNPATLLDRPAHWALFISAWLEMSNVHVVRFEDYKHDAEATLRAVLAALDLAYADHRIAEAVQLSSFERARDAERAMSNQQSFDRQIANRSGTVGEGRDNTEVLAAIPEIEDAAGTVLRRIGYATEHTCTHDTFAAARLNATLLSFFETISLPQAIVSAPENLASPETTLCALFAFAHRLDAGLLRRAGLPPAEIRQLLDSLAEATRRHAEWLSSRLETTRSNFEDGSKYFFQRVKEMRQVGKAAPASPD